MFRQATKLHADNADLPRELCLECFPLGKFAEAVEAAGVTSEHAGASALAEAGERGA